MKKLFILNSIFLFAGWAWAQEFQLNGVRIKTESFRASSQDMAEFKDTVLAQSKIKYETDDRSTRDRELYERLQLYLREVKSPEILKKLDETEIAGIQAYTNDYYYDRINGVFGNISAQKTELQSEPQVASMVKLLISGLNRLPDYDQGVLYRGLGWWETEITQEKYLKNYKSYYDSLAENSSLIFPFMSTTKDPQTKFVHCTPFVFRVLRSQSGKDISEISVNPDEKEILFKPYKVFVIKHKSTRPYTQNQALCKKVLDFDTQFIVDLEEVSSN